MSTSSEVSVWDPVVRSSHWLVAGLFLSNVWLTESGEFWHQVFGYAIVAIVLLRMVWGLVGTEYARFSEFWPTPKRVRDHLRRLRAGEPPASLGHNPLGAIMMLLLWSCLLGLGVTGWMMGLDAFWGEDWLESLHEMLVDAMLGMVVLHVGAALIESVRERQNLVRAMVTGRKRHHPASTKAAHVKP